MKKRLFRSMWIIAIAAVILTSSLVLSVVYYHSFQNMQEIVKGEAQVVAAGIEVGDETYLDLVADVKNIRITRIQLDGTVIYDNVADTNNMENHLDRPEIQAILNGLSYGEDSRISETVGEQTFYHAIKMSDDTIIRVALTTDSALGELYNAMPSIILTIVIVLIFTFLLSNRMTKAIVEPIYKIDPKHPECTPPYEELEPLMSRLMHQNKTVKRQLRSLTAKQEEFNTLSENMDEGLLLVGENAEIFSINTAACKMLGGNLNKEWAGQHLLVLSRDMELQKLVKKALNGKKDEAIFKKGDKQYEMIASPIALEYKSYGALVLFMDVTEKRQAEELRREFSSNVSHELKTPLTSISGYAEMMASGMVRPDDIQMFAKRVHDEAKRLLELIEDIMKLSRLDEGGIMPDPILIDLPNTVKITGERLAMTAKQKNVIVTTETENSQILGVPGQIAEMIYNLSENAVKYNRDGGTVHIKCEQTSLGAIVTIADTGIGIPEDAQSRIFERFYRVDKSRSKDTGGTGLGLSIVKHIATLHNAKINLDSEVGVGTTITIQFPNV